MIACHGCGCAMAPGEPMYEVARTYYYCTFCCLPGVAGDYPIVGQEVLIPTGSGYDSA